MARPRAAQMLSSHAWSGAGWFLLGLAAGRYLLGGGAPSGRCRRSVDAAAGGASQHCGCRRRAADNALLARVYPLHATAVRGRASPSSATRSSS